MKTLQQIMTKDCVTVGLQDNVFEIALKMKQHDIGFIAVVEGTQLLGVVTDRDLVIRGFADKKSGSASVAEVMTKDPITVPSETTVVEAAKIMATKKIRRLPIVNNGNLIGIVAIGDLAVRDTTEDEAGKALGQISESKKTLSKTKQ